MSPITSQPHALDVALTGAERELLLQMLETSLGELRIEVRHTRSIEYQSSLHEREDLMRTLLEKLRQ